MNVTGDVINDLLPLYYSGECSGDTKKLVEEFLKEHPDFRRTIPNESGFFPSAIPQALEKTDEMRALKRTQRLIMLRSYIMGCAIFCSLMPFAFLYAGGNFYWLFKESPLTAVVYGILGIILWIVYIVVKRKTNSI